MRDPEETTSRRVRTGHRTIETHVEYNLVDGEYEVRLNPDADLLPSPPSPFMTTAQAEQLAADLTAQVAEARRRNGVPDAPVNWAGRTFGQLTADEKRRVTREAADRLQAELEDAAPAIARVLEETGEQVTADARLIAVQAFLGEQLSRDDMSLAEITREVVRMARTDEI